MDIKKELTVSADIGNVTAVTEFLETTLEEVGCPLKTSMNLSVAVDEIFGNIARYAYTDGGEVTVTLEVSSASRFVAVTFTDTGVPFDPLAVPEPDVNLSADERKIGGLGIFMVRKMTDEMTYEYKEGKNVLKLVKRF